MNKIRTIGLLAGIAIAGLATMTSYAGWKQNNGRYYYEDNGTVVTSNWLRMSDNNGGYVYYYMGNDGYMSSGWTKINNLWYYFKDNGTMATGWVMSAISGTT